MAGNPISRNDLRTAIADSGFGAKAIRYLKDPRFQAWEVDYKLRLASRIRDAHDAILRRSSHWVDLMKKALQNPDNNIVNWRLSEKFLNWCNSKPAFSGRAIGLLLDGKGDIVAKLEKFVGTLEQAGVQQPGEQLCLASVLLMSGNVTNAPPARTGVLTNVIRELGIEWRISNSSVTERYRMFMLILDELIAYSQHSPRPLRNRLEGQGTVWCATGGWKAPPIEMASTVSEDGHIEQDIAATEPDLAPLDSTERSALVASRRGQGRYRNDLIAMWLSCSVTGCHNESVLRASHLKPWRESNNVERLNPHNGLLLVPNLDAALDAFLISFSHRGDILISPVLNRTDREMLGLHDGLKLRFVKPGHKPFLAYHRARFEKVRRCFE